MSAVLETQEPRAQYLAALSPPLVRQFDLLATAPGGVARLRELILTLAVRGKLVAQESRDEPASQLMAHIRSERERQIADGKLRRAHPQAPIDEHQMPFDLPPGWLWTRFGDYIDELCTGPFGSLIHKQDYVSGGIPLINPSHMIGGRISHDPDVAVSEEMASRLSAYRLSRNDVLLARRGEVGRYALVTDSEDGWLCGTGSFFVKLNAACNRRYFGLMLDDPALRRHLQGESVGSTMTNLNQRILLDSALAVPPLPEQARIVARVDELMRLCDALEAKGRLEADHHHQLLTTLLGTLTDSRTPEDLAANWQRVAEHFDLLLDRPEAVEALEVLIVNFALRGLLTSQCADEEPAATFIAQINPNRTQRRAAAATPVLAAVVEDGLPTGWCKTNVGSVAECLDYLRRPVKKADREASAGTVPYYGANGQVGFITEYLFDEDLVLVVEDETFIGRTKPFSYVIRGKSWVNNHAHVLRPLGGMSAEYLDLCLQRYDFIPLTSGTTNRRKLTQPGLLNAEFMIAPLGEQARIVARVTQLRQLCSTLRQRLAAGQAVQAQLAEALVDQAVNV